ncbi:MAG TPA: hypothetical protein VFQ70_04080 [Candidatus Saccharimonadaceae bacterium]|nr:hypothetical protein [Candidatus Saccharimonadaceae bacterium]
MSEHVFDANAWSKQSIFWQLGNIGSEVGRALKAKRDGNEKRMTSAFYRGMDLINATIDSFVKRGKSPYELLIAREQFAKSILTDDIDVTLEKYFMDFAVAARRDK